MSSFVPVSDTIPMDREHSVQQMTGRYQSVRDGLPELVKNSKDQYSRLGITEKADRQVVVLVSGNSKHIAVLDFAGAGEEDFEGWIEWSSRTAGRAHLAYDIEAGLGNGGKAFMVRGCQGEAYMYSSREGRRTKMGFDNQNPSVRYIPGWFREGSGAEIRGLPDGDPIQTLDDLLRPLGTRVHSLPRRAQEVLRRRNSFTLVVLENVTDLLSAVRRRDFVRAIPASLRQHPQAALTIESSEVWPVHGRDALTSTPLEVERPEAMDGFERPLTFVIPQTLVDPETQEDVAVPAAPGQLLELWVSARNLRMSNRAALNVIRVCNGRNVVASWKIAQLDPTAYSAYLYGFLRTPAIAAGLQAGSDRQELADVPLVRALQAWSAERVREVAEMVERARGSRESEAARSRANSILEGLRELMRRFLEPRSTGPHGVGPDLVGPIPPRARVPGEFPHRLVLEQGRETLIVPLGTSVPLLYTVYDDSDPEKPLAIFPRPAVRLMSGTPGIAVMETPGTLSSVSGGETEIWLETDSGEIESNRVKLRVLPVSSVEVRGPAEDLKQGQRHQLDLTAITGRFRAGNLVYETSVDEPGMGQLGRAGVFTAGGIPGIATARVRYGPRTQDSATCSIRIGDERVERPGSHGGGDIPKILMCGTIVDDRDEITPRSSTMTPSGKAMSSG